MSEIGAKLKEIRQIRHMKISEVASGCAQFGLSVSDSQISMWENGKRRIYADQLEILCKVLECTPVVLFPNYGMTISDNTLDYYSNAGETEKNIWRYCCSEWEGNSKALVNFMGLYMSLPKKQRKDLAEYGIWRYEKCVEEGIIIDNAPKLNIEYIKKEASKIV